MKASGRLRTQDICFIARQPHGDRGLSVVLKIECQHCPAHAEHVAGYRVIEPAEIIRIFEGQGWRHRSRRKWTCPACLKAQKAYRKGGQVVRKETPTMAEVKANGAAGKIDVPAKDVRRIMAAVEERWVDDKRLYVDGWSDEKVGLELGVPRAAVAQVREEFFGALAEDPDIVDLRSRLDDLLTQAANIEKRIGKIEDDRRRRGG